MANLSQSTLNESDRNISDGLFYDNVPTPFIVMLFFLILATILTNSAVFIVVYAFRGLRTVTNCFVVSLASADLAVALLAMPLWLVSELLRLNEDVMKVLQMSIRWVDVFCCSASIFNATLVSIDRYLAINKPLRYREMVTRRRAHRSIAGVWFLSFIVANISFVQYTDNCLKCIYGFAIFLFILLLCIPLCIMCFSYTCIYRVAVAQLSKMVYNGHTSSLGEEEKRRHLVTERRKRFYKELRITKTLAITVSLFVIAWAPYLVMIMIETFSDLDVPLEFQIVVVWAPYINSFANPLIYTGINKDFRKALKKLLCSPNPTCYCMKKNTTERNRGQNPSRSLVGSGYDTATTSFNRASNSRPQDIQCTSV